MRKGEGRRDERMKANLGNRKRVSLLRASTEVRSVSYRHLDRFKADQRTMEGTNCTAEVSWRIDSIESVRIGARQ